MHPTPNSSSSLQPEVLQALQSFRLIVRSIKQHFQHVQDATGLSGSQLWCLAAIRTTPGQRVTALARTLGIRQATASNLVEVLERKGLLERRRDQKDQRAVSVFLTEAGRLIAQAAPEPVAGILPDALGRLAPTDLSELNGLLDRLIALMALRDESGRGIPLADL